MWKGVGVDQHRAPAAASRRARALGWWLFVLCIGGLAAWGHTTPAHAIGEGVYSLDQSQYSVNEGEALTVNVNRVSGGTLASDVTVTLELLNGTPGLDFPNAAT